MGQVILEVPQNVNLVFRIESEKQATDILEQLKRSKFELAVARGEIELPKRRHTKKILDTMATNKITRAIKSINVHDGAC